MKKFFTLIAVAMLALTAMAEEVLYSNSSATVVDGFSTITYADGAKLILSGNAGKAWSSASSITINGEKYVTTKVSNGAQNTFVAPEGKKVSNITFFSYVNKDAAARTPYWKEINGTTYNEETATIMQAYKGDTATPDEISFTLSNVSSFTFTNTGEQACFVLKVEYATVDFSALKAKVSEAQAMKKEELASAIAAALDVLDTPTSTQEEVDAALEDLQAAIDALPVDWTDVTAQYLANSSFNGYYNFDVTSEAADITNSNNVVEAWENVNPTAAGVSGIFQYGTPVTVNGSVLPAAGIDGSSDGGMLVLRPTAKAVMSYCVEITEENPFPAGEYTIVLPILHIGDAQTKNRLQSRFEYLKSDDEGNTSREQIYSSIYGSSATLLPNDEWISDSIKFELEKPATGKVYLTIGGPSSFGASKGGICIDYVKILYKPTPTAIKEVATAEQYAAPKAKKVLKNGKLVIVKNGKKFNVAGVEQK